ncbi:MAG: AAA family ATPase [Candidatus Magasanikbacteria bacterium]|nr:AAA family ATPase [Candidatus Magasanikbacteria bacterium]
MSDYALNNFQKQAVEYSDGPLLIVAGAGTGKTSVITNKIIHLIKKGLAKPEEILALTFTDKAAAEMELRVDEMLGNIKDENAVGYLDLQISTFHTFCQRILESHAIDIGLSNSFKLLTETETWLMMRENLYEFEFDYYRPLGNPTKHIHELLKHFSKCKDELIEASEYMEYAENIEIDKDNKNIDEKSRLKEVATLYHQYNQMLLDNNAMDFGDLIFYTVKLIRKNKKIAELLQNQYKYILVDEFQDVNYAQYELVKLISKKAQLTVVGDDDQSIYAFRGASVSNIMRFKDDYRNCKDLVLNKNYRSHQAILDIAYDSIQYNNPDRLEVKLEIDKKLKFSGKNKRNDESGIVNFLHCKDVDSEVREVINKITEIKQNKKCLWDDFAILVRANNHAEVFVNAMESAGIPYEFLASSGLFRQAIVIDSVNFLKLIDNYHESILVFRLLKLPFWNFSENDLQKITSTAKRKTISYYTALKKAQEFGLSKEGIKTCDELLKLIHNGMKTARFEKPSKVLYEFLDKSGYLKYLIEGEDRGQAKVIREIYHIKQFFEYIDKYENANPEATVSSFIEYYLSLLESGDDGNLYQPEDTPDSVNIMTIHGAKGLEYKYVFLVNLVQDRFPTRRRSEAIKIPRSLIKEDLPEGDIHEQEERRLFYVAITRAEDRLFFTSADYYGGVRKKKISKFLVELGFDSKNKAKDETGSVIKFLPKESKSVEEKAEMIYELPKTFSFSQIRSYETCPYQYKLNYILKLQTKGNASFSFGKSMHSTMQKFYSKIQQLNEVKQDSLFGLPKETVVKSNIKVPPVAKLIKIYEENWIEDWYKSKQQRETYYKKGKKILKAFYSSQENNWTIPVALEKWFKIKVGNYLIRGSIDRVDKIDDNKLEIIDYKTGKSKEKLSTNDKDQLLIYQMAAETLPEYKNLGLVDKLTFYYLNDNLQVSFLGKEKEIDKIKKKIVKSIDEIQNGNFKATPSKFKCKYCDFKDVCGYRKI